MLNIETRTTHEQMKAIRDIIDEGAIIHEVRHNLDGLWINLWFTSGDGDWVASIDRAGHVERTQ